MMRKSSSEGMEASEDESDFEMDPADISGIIDIEDSPTKV